MMNGLITRNEQPEHVMNRTTTTTIGALAATALLGGLFLSPIGFGGSDSAPTDDAETSAQSVVITAQELKTDKMLAGVKVSIIDPDGKSVGQQQTTGSDGLATVVIPGAENLTYRIVAIAPDSKWLRSADTDGQSAFGSLACADILDTFDPDTCIYMHRDQAGTLTMPNRGSNVDGDLASVDNARFVFEVPTTATDPTEPVEPAEQELDAIGEPIDPANDETTGEAETTAEETDHTTGNPGGDTDQTTELGDEEGEQAEDIAVESSAPESVVVCASFVHAPPADDASFPSRIEIDVDAGTEARDLAITIPGANDDMAVTVDVSRDTAVLGIRSYGDYKISTVVLGGSDVTSVFASLPTITVDDTERTAWCIDFQIPAAGDTTSDPVATFVDDFSSAHAAQDSDALLAALHPRAIEAFGAAECEAHVRGTAGVITDIELTNATDVGRYELDAPTGTLVFDHATKVNVDWVEQGTPVNGVSFHIISEGADLFYLSTCGQ